MWGVAAAILNFLPYIGALVAVLLVAVISLANDGIVIGLIAPDFVLACNTVEGQVITRLTLGRRLGLNTVAVHLHILLVLNLGFYRGAARRPMLVIIKVIGHHFDPLQAFGNLLSAQQTSTKPEE